MNSRIWPNYTEITPVNQSSQNAGDIQQAFATLNTLIDQFNQLVSLQGGLEKQIAYMSQQIQLLSEGSAGIQPFSGSNDTGYLTNGNLKSWPADNFTLAATVDGSSANLFDIEVDDAAPYAAFGQKAGPLYVLGQVGGAVGGVIYFDVATTLGAVGACGIGEDSAGDLLLGADGVEMLRFDISVPAAILSADAGTLAVLGGQVALDSEGDFGMSVSSGNLVLWAVDGEVQTASVLKAGGYKASTGESGTTATTGGVVFKDGLYISGTIDPSADTGYVEEVPADSTPYVRFNSGSPAWQALSTYFAGLTAGAEWTGSSDIVTLGTIATGVWQGTDIADDYIASAATWNGKQDALGAGSAGQYLKNGPAWATLDNTAVGLGNVTNDAQIKASIGAAKGDLITFSASATPVRIGAGAEAGVLVTDGSGGWSIDTEGYIAESIGTSAGQLLTFSASATPDVFDPGVDDGFLFWSGSAWSIEATTLGLGAVTLPMIADIAAGSVLGNNTGSASEPIAMTVAQTRTLLGIANVQDIALSTWAGSTNLTTAGNLTVGTLTGTGNIGTNMDTGSLFGAGFNVRNIYPVQNGTGSTYGDGIHIRGTTSGNPVCCRFDTLNSIVYPVRLVIPT